MTVTLLKSSGMDGPSCQMKVMEVLLTRLTWRYWAPLLARNGRHAEYREGKAGETTDISAQYWRTASSSGRTISVELVTLSEVDGDALGQRGRGGGAEG